MTKSKQASPSSRGYGKGAKAPTRLQLGAERGEDSAEARIISVVPHLEHESMTRGFTAGGSVQPRDVHSGVCDRCEEPGNRTGHRVDRDRQARLAWYHTGRCGRASRQLDESRPVVEASLHPVSRTARPYLAAAAALAIAARVRSPAKAMSCAAPAVS